MTPLFFAALLAKMLATATLVIGAARLAETRGPFVGAMVATLPVSAGPAYVFLAMDHPPDFIARAALSTLTINLVTVVYTCTYALLSRRPLIIAFGGAFAAWLATTLILRALNLPFAVILPANLVVLLAASRLMRSYKMSAAVARPTPRWWETPMRAALVMTIVVTVVLVADRIGPQWTGVISGLPVAFTSLILVMHGRMGGPMVAAVLVNGLPGLIGFGLALATVHLLAVPLGSPAALALALCVSLVWNAGLMLRARHVARLAQPA